MIKLKTSLVVAFAMALVFPLSLPLPGDNFPTSIGEAQAAGNNIRIQSRGVDNDF